MKIIQKANVLVLSSLCQKWAKIALCFVLYLTAVLSPSEGAIITASSCSQPDVKAAIDFAQDGDTVLVPAGISTWTTGITTSKGITIRGAGIGQTIIKENFSLDGSIFKFETIAGKSYRVTGFEFKDGASRSTVFPAGIIRINGESNSIRIDHNKWDRVKAVHVRTNGWVRGVSDNNVHLASGTQVYHLWHAGWAGGTMGDKSWSEEIDWGGPNSWYIENNYIEAVDGIPAKGVTDTYGGARFVFRYNTIVNASLSSHGTGDGAGTNRGLRQFEVYNNTITYHSTNTEEAFHVRGGTGIYYNNTHVGIYKSITLRYYRAGARSDGNGFGRADGLNPFDINDMSDGPSTPGGTGDGVFASGVAGAGSRDLVLEVPGAGWAPNQWVGYMVRVPNSSVHPNGTWNSVVVSHDSDSITVHAPNFPSDNPHTFVPGEVFELRRVLLGLDQTGAGTSGTMIRSGSDPIPSIMNQQYDPVYVWGNQLNGAKPALGLPPLIENTHFMKEISSYDGSSGMGSGPLSARPSSPSLLRTAYFATDVGKKGTLYVWNGASWITRWSPYAYPHPLTQSGIASDDNDGDGLLDTWETLYFGSISDPRATSAADPDGDGLDNLAEQTAGTLPLNSASRLAITDQRFLSSTHFQIQWKSVADKTYEVQMSTNMTGWSTVTNLTASSTNTTWTDTTVTGSVKKFYRVRVP